MRVRRGLPRRNPYHRDVPQKEPDFADIYGIAPVLIDDKHRAPRRCAVTQSREDYVTVFGRTTQVHLYQEASDLLSDPEPACRLDKPGMYTTRHKYSIARPAFNDEQKARYYGTLGRSHASGFSTTGSGCWGFVDSLDVARGR